MPNPAGVGPRADPFGAFTAWAQETPPGTGELIGLRVAVKDLIAVEGLPNEGDLPGGTPCAPADADAVRRLRQAGGTIVGVTRTDAGGFGTLTPAVSNPRSPDHYAGGSSGGSAAAVASGLSDAALGTDTGGSVRIPAACCGVYGYKPTTGCIDMTGTRLLAETLDTLGILAARLTPLRRVADVLLSEPPANAASATRRILFDDTWQRRPGERAHTEMAAVLDSLTAAGANVAKTSLPVPSDIIRHHGTLVCAEAYARYGDAWRQAPESFPRPAAAALQQAQTLSDADIATARKTAASYRTQLDGILARGDDILIVPTLPCAVPRRDGRKVTLDGRDVPLPIAMMWHTALFNLTGHPVVAVPLPGTAGHPPNSLQLIARRGDDQALLGFAQTLATLVADHATPK